MLLQMGLGVRSRSKESGWLLLSHLAATGWLEDKPNHTTCRIVPAISTTTVFHKSLCTNGALNVQLWPSEGVAPQKRVPAGRLLQC